MAIFIEPASSGELAEAVAGQLARVGERFRSASVRVAAPGEGPDYLADRWRVIVEAPADIEELKQECLDLLGE